MTELEQFKQQLEQSIVVEHINPPVPASELVKIERQVGVPFPSWLKEFYTKCNGFEGETGIKYAWNLNEISQMTLCIRGEEWAPPWINKAILFGDNGFGGTSTEYWVALEGKLVRWCLGDGPVYHEVSDLETLWKTLQTEWDELDLQDEG